MKIYVLLAILSVIVQCYFIYQIYRQTRKFSSLEISEDDLDQLDVDSEGAFPDSDGEVLFEEKVELFSNLKWNVSKSTSLGFVKNSLDEYYSRVVDTISHFGNLGPAFGLIFTFLGMIITFWEINTSSMQQSQVKAIVVSMAPIILGSLFGMITYSISRYYDHKISLHIDRVRSLITESLKRYHEEELPENIEDAYGKILNSLTNLRSELKGVAINISDYSDIMAESNAVFEQSVSELGKTSTSLASDYSEAQEKLTRSSSTLFDKFNTYSEGLANASTNLESLFDTQKASTKLMTDMMDEGISFTKAVKLSGDAIQKIIETAENQNKASENLIKTSEGFGKIQAELSMVTLDIKDIHQTSSNVAKNIDTISQLFPVNTFNDMRVYLQTISESIENLGMAIKENQILLAQKLGQQKEPTNSLPGDTSAKIVGLLNNQLAISKALFQRMDEENIQKKKYRRIYYPLTLAVITSALVFGAFYDNWFPQKMSAAPRAVDTVFVSNLLPVPAAVDTVFVFKAGADTSTAIVSEEE